VTALVVAALAEQRGLSDKKPIMVTPMDLVAIHAIFAHRRVFPGVGPSFVRVTFEAEFVDRIRLDHLGAETTHGVVALGTTHLSFPNRMMRLSVRLRPDVLVAGEAKIGFPLFE